MFNWSFWAVFHGKKYIHKNCGEEKGKMEIIEVLDVSWDLEHNNPSDMQENILLVNEAKLIFKSANAY